MFARKAYLRWEHLKGGSHLLWPYSQTLGNWKRLPGTNTPAYWVHSEVPKKNEVLLKQPQFAFYVAHFFFNLPWCILCLFECTVIHVQGDQKIEKNSPKFWTK
jgi:hypothetical protein